MQRARLTHATLLTLAIGLTVAATVHAQEGRIYGTVNDTSGGALPGATVTVKNVRTGLTQVVVTDARGEYQARALPTGRYSVSGELQGFKTIIKTDIDVGIGTQVQVDLQLEVGALEESITVSGEAPLVDTRRSEVGANISEEQIETLPVQGRQWIDLATLLPGTGQDAIRARYYNSVNIGAGINFYSNGFYVDGVNNNWQQQGEPRQDFPQDSIAEFRVHAFNARSMYGFAQGGVLSTVTKSGTNGFHGTLFEFYRDKALNAKTVFQSEKPDYHRHQAGGSLGGPVIRDRAHFFFAGEYTDESEFFTVNTNGAFPEEEGTFERPSWVYMLVGRYDQYLADNHRAFFRVGRQDSERGFNTAGGTRARDAGYAFAAPRLALVFGETWTIDGGMLNDFRFQYAKATYIGWPSVPGLKWTNVGEFPDERIDSVPDIIVRPSLTRGTGSAFIGPEARWEVKNDFSKFFGRHEITVGADLNWVRWNPDNLGISRQWSFSTNLPFDPNNPATHPFLFTQRLGPTYDDIRTTEHSVYVDDSWSVHSRVTLNLGLRYDWQNGVWNENLLEEEQPEIAALGRVIRPGGLPDPALFPFYEKSTRGDWNNLGPRVGVSWNVNGDGRQVVRGAYGVYFNRFRANGGTRGERNPRSLSVIIRNPSYPDPYQGRDPFELASSTPSFSVLSNEAANPHTHQFSLGYSRQIGANLGISVDATVAEGRDQHSQIDSNYFADPSARAAGVRPDRAYGRITEGRTDGKMEYRALDIRFDRRLASNWQLLGSYTAAWAKNDVESFPADHYNPGADYGYADADRRHRMVLSGIVQTVSDIQASAILRYQSALAFDVTAGRDLNGDGIGNDRPTGVIRNEGCRGLNLDAVNVYRTANGLTPVDGVSCNGYLSLDLQFSKAFSFGGDRELEGIFQVFNLFNRSNYLQPVANALSPSFGKSLEVASPRQMEVAVRFRF